MPSSISLNCGSVRIFSFIGVAVLPGRIAFTAMLCGLSSSASERVRRLIAAFVAQ